MLRTITYALFGFIAAGVIAAPIASADDLTNTEVMQSETQTAPETPPPSPVVYATGDNTPKPYGILTKNCQPVMGTFVADKGFVPDPNGKQIAYTNDGGKTFRSNGYKNGLN